ncbi:ribonuclease HII [Erysipelothrix sp. HDW6C]|uniref:ribonuclease HII n=1 Tax=Erysipelothrix sp. HDW6C TaxID=2714930 RepID=UPI0014083943|nr:ribonuclease HII [Erysipelothrix sp. HDW6C]QIK70391.1 ribonuclease HII [Erysipelothrix sp. HDW6C]
MGSLVTEFESKYWAEDKTVVGIDEAGRGPMAGPCVVCGVVFPIGFDNELINDSKKLSAKRRLELVDIIKENALWYQVEIIEPEAIDHDNIYRATQKGMERIASAAPCDAVLTDAMPLIDAPKPFEAIIKGDARSLSIAAASILAKTIRDQIMIELDIIFPQYGFKNHKGYGTKQHKEAILKYGRSPVHRESFRFKDEDQISLDI